MVFTNMDIVDAKVIGNNFSDHMTAIMRINVNVDDKIA